MRKDYLDLSKKITEYAASWDKTISQRKAAYYYNLAENLIEESKKLSINDYDFDLKKNLLSTSIMCLETSHIFYKEGKQQQYANETLKYKADIEELLKKLKKKQAQLNKSQKHSLIRKKISAKPDKSPALTNSSKTFDNSHPVALKNQNEPSNTTLANFASSVSSKKRKNWIMPDVEEPTSKKTYIAPNKINVTINVLLRSEEEAVQQRVKEFKENLTQAPMDNPFRFYGQLFFKLSQQLQVYSYESSNHTLLTQLSWLAIAQQLIDLIPNKNPMDNTALDTIANNIMLISTKHKKTLDIISAQKRDEAYPTYIPDLQSKNLQNLLIKEVIDYYYGLEAFNLTSITMSFLNLTSRVIKQQSFSNTFEEIENTIQSAYKLNENLFFAKLLRELVKFHICSENANWQSQTFSPESIADRNKEYLRILTISERFAEESSNEQQELKTRIQQLKIHLLQQFSPKPNLTLSNHTYSASAFFQPPKPVEPLSTKLLNTTLREHVQCLVKCRAAYILPETICKHFLQFIHTYCQQDQASISHNRVVQP